MRKKGAMLTFAILLCFLAGISCDESLPPYHDPTDVLTSTQNVFYVISPLDNSLKVIVNVINTFDDAFEGRAFFDGNVVITLASDPSFQKTFLVSSGNILSGQYNSSSRRLTIDPGDTLKLFFSWGFADDSGRLIRNIISYHQDPMCRERFISSPLTFTVRSEVKVFEKIDFVSAPTSAYLMVHHREFFLPNYCTPL